MRLLKRSLLGLSRRLAIKSTAARASNAGPKFDQNDLFSDLIESVEAQRAWRDGRKVEAWTALASYFCERDVPRLFFAPAEVARLSEQAEQRIPSWRDRLLSAVAADRREGLAVYDRRGARFTAGFDWTAAPDNPLSDRLYRVRPHRFGFLPRWALACQFDPACIAPLQGALAGWITHCGQANAGPAYSSSHVVLYRLVAGLLAWPLLAALDRSGSGDRPVAALQRCALHILYEDARFISRVAGHAAPNNHLLADYFGGWLVARLFPEFAFGLDAVAAETAWLNELNRQTYEDGGSFEHSVHYQEHACEMGVAYLLLSRANGWEIPGWAETRIAAMLRFQLCLTGPHLIALSVGDTTEDPLLPLGPGEGWQSGALSEIYRSAFRSDIPPARDSHSTTGTAHWLLNGELANPAKPTETSAAFSAFQDSGFHVFSEPAHNARLVHRLGPSRDRDSLGGHAHSDLLSVYLSVAGQSVLAAPGTYSYRHKPHPELAAHPNLRAFFSGAQCRSGLVLDGLDHYGPLTGDFRSRELTCHVAEIHAVSEQAGLSWGEGVVAGTNAYTGYRRGIIHVHEQFWLVYDTLPARPAGRQTDADSFVGWQFAPAINCTLQENGTVQAGTGQPDDLLVSMVPCNVGPATLMTGNASPFRGWVSPSYGRLEPAANLRYTLTPSNRTSSFILDPSKDQVTSELRLLFESNDSLGFFAGGLQQYAITLLNFDNENVETAWDRVNFVGRLLHFSKQRNGVMHVRALGMRRLQIADIDLDLTVAGSGRADVNVLISDGKLTWPRGRNRDIMVGGQAN